MKMPALFAFHGEPKFVTDGCSGFMTWAWLAVFGKLPPWNGGCVIHDWYYWSGGSPINGRAAYQIRRLGGGPIEPVASPFQLRTFSRRDADAFLYRYIKHKGYRVWAWLCWIAVRLGGSQYLPFAWRWRYRDSYADVVRGK